MLANASAGNHGLYALVAAALGAIACTAGALEHGRSCSPPLPPALRTHRGSPGRCPGGGLSLCAPWKEL